MGMISRMLRRHMGHGLGVGADVETGLCEDGDPVARRP